jgi:predicted enzyme related to lactoylglutathione lyase
MGLGSRWIELAPPGGNTNIVLFVPSGDQPRSGSFMTLTFTSDDVRGTYNELAERGVSFTHTPTDEPWGRYCAFSDPDGNHFVIAQAE